MKLIPLFILISQNCFADGFAQFKDFAEYLNAGSPSLEASEIKAVESSPRAKRDFLQLGLELGVSNPTLYSAKSDSESGSEFSSRGMKSNLPEIRANLGINFTQNFSAQFNFAHYEQIQDYSQTSNFVFNSQTFLAGQNFTFKNSVNLFRGLVVYDANPIGPFQFGLGVGLMNVNHKTTVTMTGTNASANKDVVLPLVHAHSTFDLLGPFYMHGEFTSYPLAQKTFQSDAAIGFGVEMNSIDFKIGSRWIDSAIDKYELTSKLQAQVFFLSIGYSL